MDPLSARKTLASIRVVLGIGALLAPRLTGKVFGIDVDANPAVPYLARLFGARELFMASPFLMPAPGLDEQELAARAVPVDTADAIAALAAGLKGYLPWRAVVPAAGTAMAAAYLGSLGSKPQ